MPFLGDEAYTDRVVQLALDNVRAGGRPFACLIVNRENGEILAEAANKVAQTGNATSHAEIMAIHTASAKLRARNGDVDGTNGTAGEDMKGYAF